MRRDFLQIGSAPAMRDPAWNSTADERWTKANPPERRNTPA